MRFQRYLTCIWTSLRPKQWTKNLFVFAGILFSQNILNLSLLYKTISAAFIFCLLSGSVYILNDLCDLKEDRRHPVKSRRSLASGRLKISYAVVFLVIFIPFILAVSWRLSHSFSLIVLAYLLLQTAYSLFLKHVVILDIFTIACGFVLRVIAGAAVINVEASSYLIICTILLSLFLGLGKRRYELAELKEGAESHRKVLAGYSPHLLNQMLSVTAVSTIIAYILYTISERTIDKFGTRNLVFTIPFVLYGVFRYLYLIHHKGEGGNPEDILVTDVPLIINLILWAAAVGAILYGFD